MAAVENLTLPDGTQMPLLGYGLGTANYKKSGPGGGIDQTIVDNTVAAIKAGWTHLDGAELYGNEAELGAAIKQAGVPREKLYITTKTEGKNAEPLATTLDRSLQYLGVDYVDLYLIHQPWFTDTPEGLQARWAEMEAIKDSGKAKTIGVSNYIVEHLEATLAKAKYKPTINQIEFHPYLQHEELQAFQKKHNIAFSAYGPLSAVTKASPGPLDPVYKRLAEKYGASEGEIAVRWVLDQGIVALTTTANEQRLKSYLTKVPSFKLTQSEIDEISEIGKQKHYRGFWGKKIAADDRR